MSAFTDWKKDNQDFFDSYGVPEIIAERIFNAGVLAERTNTIELIQQGIIKLAHPKESEQE